MHLDAERAAQPLRHVLEPRHASFLSEPCVALLRAHNVALAITDSPHWPYAEEPTADFMYLRLHGSQQLYASRYTDEELVHWARRVRAFQRGSVPRAARRIGNTPAPRIARDVYVYFDNDAQAFAAHDALRLIARLSRKSPERARHVLATVHPSSILRSRSSAEREAAYASFVADLRVVAKLLAGEGAPARPRAPARVPAKRRAAALAPQQRWRAGWR